MVPQVTAITVAWCMKRSRITVALGTSPLRDLPFVTIPMNINPPFTMAHNIMAPGYRSSTHYHTKVCRGTYIAKGRIRFFFGPEDNQQVIDGEVGDYVYTALGEIHSQLNLSETDTAEYVSCYVGESDRTKIHTVILDTPKK